jgi:hypothetical protein
MPISWNEIRHNAIKFSGEWKGAKSESAEKQTFWNEFFQVFGIKRRVVASFEEPAKRISGTYGFIDLLWRGVLLVEHKSFGEDLGKAKAQAFNYIQDLANEGRHAEIPRYIIVSDFARVALHDLEPEEQRDLPLFDKRRGTTIEFPLADFHKYIHAFAFIPGYKQHTYKEEDPINIEAAEILGNLHDALEAGGYTGHDLERFLVRILFCLFAEDTGIFERESFHLFLQNRTAADGSDLGQSLALLFEILNTPPENRQKNLDETLAAFPYVNGDLFSEHLGFAAFNRDMRNALLGCCQKDWSRISPAIFGSLFQAVMEPKERRQIGGHYTSERDILKVIRSLFLDDLRAEFESIKADRSNRRRARLEEFHEKLCRLRFLDPACGCGNFLVITYRELRQLELEVLLLLFGKQAELTLDEINRLSRVNVDQFYGIEIGEWPARIAEVALWLMDHQMNQKISAAFGQLYQRLPLKKSPHIHCANALRLDWKTVLPPEQCSYVLGNPPFVGKQFMTEEQNADMEFVCGDVKGHGLLDFVTAWYFKAVEYINGTKIVVGFVSTNSITQGEQAGILWRALFQDGVKIHFGHRTFAWESEARGKAHVHVVIVGFGVFDRTGKKIYDYEVASDNRKTPGEPAAVVASVSEATNISPYLIAGPDISIMARSKPLCPVPEIVFGSMPNDGGHLLFSQFTKEQFLKRQPDAARFLRRFVGAEEFLNGTERWCLWLYGVSPGEFRRMTAVKDCIDAVQIHRQNSLRETTKKLANAAAYFGEIRQPDCPYLLIPSVSSERRRYIPIGFMRPEIIASNLVLLVPAAESYHFGVLSSAMHMAWVRQVCGRLKSDYRYSNKIVYNNYPWPDTPSDEQRRRVEDASRRILELRSELGDGRAGFLPVKQKNRSASLADLYDGQSMPLELRKAHAELDRAVEKCYRPEPFDSDRQRVEFLFALYEKLTAPLLPVTPKTKGRRSQTAATARQPRKQKTPVLYSQKIPPGKSTAESEAAAAHFWMAKEEPPMPPGEK